MQTIMKCDVLDTPLIDVAARKELFALLFLSYDVPSAVSLAFTPTAFNRLSACSLRGGGLCVSIPLSVYFIFLFDMHRHTRLGFLFIRTPHLSCSLICCA